MRRYALQLSGHDFEPSSHWSTDIRPVVNELVTRDDVDLLMWDPATDASEIYEQYSLATLMGQIETSAYARLLTTMGQVLVELKQSVSPRLQQQWYLASYLACLDHQSLLNTAAALLSLTVAELKSPTVAADQQLRGLADQARCWLLAAKVSDLQLLATPQPLFKLSQQLLTQVATLDFCCVTGQSRGWQLANDAYWLSQVTSSAFSCDRLQRPTAYRLLRAAHLEHLTD